jgi:hypothetical protein
LQEIAACVKRLDKLSRRLAKEEVKVRHCHDALLYRERQDYLKAIREKHCPESRLPASHWRRHGNGWRDPGHRSRQTCRQSALHAGLPD